MQKRRKIFLISLTAALVFLFTGCGEEASKTADQDDGKLEVYTSFYTMYDFASKIGGDRVKVINMVPDGMEPHDWEPTPAEIARLEKAKLFIFHGLGLEPWVEKTLASLSNQDLIIGIASYRIVDIRDEQSTVEVDAHLWLDPFYAKVEMENIKQVLVKADPDGAAYYEANYEHYAAKCDELNEKYQTTIASLSKRDVVVTHAAFGYLCAAYDLNQIALSGLSPEAEPSPAVMAEVIDFVKTHEVRVIFYEELIDPKVSLAIARETGAEVDCLSPIEGLSDEQRAAGEDYFSLMEQNLNALVRALQ